MASSETLLSLSAAVTPSYRPQPEGLWSCEGNPYSSPFVRMTQDLAVFGHKPGSHVSLGFELYDVILRLPTRPNYHCFVATETRAELLQMSGDVIHEQALTPLVEEAVPRRVGIERRLTSWLRSNHSPRRIILHGGSQLAVCRGHGNSRSVLPGCVAAL